MRGEIMVQAHFIQSDTVRLQYFEHGHGRETLVLVHGYQTSGRIWQLTQEALDPAQYHTIAISNRGAGDSDRGQAEADYTVQAFARDLLGAISALGLQDFTLVGHSMGGATVTQFALEHQQFLKGLVLLNAAPLNGRPLADGWEAQLRQQFAQGSAPQVNFGPRAATLPADFVGAVEADVARNPLERALGGRRSMSQLRLREQLSQLAVPVLVIGGDLDTTVGVDNILADYLALPADRRFLHIYHGVGHSPNVEVPLELAALLRAFVDRIASAAGQKAIGAV
jgi:branched-chain amino acid transport system permease protein